MNTFPRTLRQLTAQSKTPSSSALQTVVDETEPIVAQLVSLGRLIPAGSRTRKVTTYAATALTALTVTQAVWNQIEQRQTWTVTVDGGSWLYGDVGQWVQTMAENLRHKGFRLDLEDGKPVIQHSVRGRTHLKIDGYSVHVDIEKPTHPPRHSLTGLKPEPRIVFTVTSEAAFHALSKRLTVIKNSAAQSRHLYTHDGYDWCPTRKLPARTLDSVVLPAGQHERIFTDLEHFLASEDLYVSMGMPWHRGYLFAGTPGTGKTSYATALATHFGRNVYFLSLANIPSDVGLFQLVNAIPENAFLLVEDIDSAGSPTRNKNANSSSPDENGNPAGGVTLSGLLNVLDGVATPHGLITIITTNHPEQLDPALIRAGRVDLAETFTPLTPEQTVRIITRFLPTALPTALTIPHSPLTAVPADIMNIIKRHHDDPATAIPAINALLISPQKDPHSPK